MDGEAILTGIGAAALLIVGGGLGGALVSLLGERQRWVRDQRLHAYAALLAVADASLVASTGQWSSVGTDMTTGPAQAALEALATTYPQILTHLDATIRAKAMVTLLGPDRVAEAGDKLLGVVIKDWHPGVQVTLVASDQAKQIDVDEHHAKLRERRQGFIRYAKAALKIGWFWQRRYTTPTSSPDAVAEALAQIEAVAGNQSDQRSED